MPCIAGTCTCLLCVSLMAAIAGASILVPCHVVRSLQLIWRSDTRRFHLRVPDLQMSCIDLTLKIGHQYSSPSNGHQSNIPYWTTLCFHFQCLHLELCDILGTPEALFHFMQFMKTEASVNVLQFYLSVGKLWIIHFLNENCKHCTIFQVSIAFGSSLKNDW